MFFTKFGGTGSAKTSQRLASILQKHCNGDVVDEDDILWAIQQPDFLLEFERGDKGAVRLFGDYLPLVFESALSHYQCVTECSDESTSRSVAAETTSSPFKSRSDQCVSSDELSAASATVVAPMIGSRQSKLVEAARSSVRLLCGRAPEAQRRVESLDSNVRSVWGNLWTNNNCRALVAGFFSGDLSSDVLNQIAQVITAAARPLEEESSTRSGSEVVPPAILPRPPPLTDPRWLERLLNAVRILDALVMLAGDVLVDGLPLLSTSTIAVEGARRVFDQGTSMLWSLVDLCCNVYHPGKQSQMESWYHSQIYVTQDQLVAVDWLHEAYEAAALCCLEVSGTFQCLICRSPLTATAVAAQVADRIPRHGGASGDGGSQSQAPTQLTSAGAMLPRIFSLAFLSRFPLSSLGAESLYQFLSELLFVCLPARSLTVADLASQWFLRDALNRWDLPTHSHGFGVMLHVAGLQDALPSKDPNDDHDKHDWGQVRPIPLRCDDDDSLGTTPALRVVTERPPPVSTAPLSPPSSATPPAERRRTKWRYTSLLLSVAKAYTEGAEESACRDNLLGQPRVLVGASGSSLLLRGIAHREATTVQRLQRLRLLVRFLDSAQYATEATLKKAPEGMSRDDLRALPLCAEALVSLLSDWCLALRASGVHAASADDKRPTTAHVAVTSATVNCVSLLLIELVIAAVRTSVVEALSASPRNAANALKMTVEWMFHLADHSSMVGSQQSIDGVSECGCWLSLFAASLSSASKLASHRVLVEGHSALVASLDVALHAVLRWRQGGKPHPDGVPTADCNDHAPPPLSSDTLRLSASTSTGISCVRVTTIAEVSDLLVELLQFRALLLGCGGASIPPAVVRARLSEYIASAGGDLVAHQSAIPPSSPFSPRTPASSSTAPLTFDAILANSPGRQKLALLLPSAPPGSAVTQTFPGDVDLFLSWDGEGEEVPSFENATVRTRHRRVLSHPAAVSPSEHETVGGAFDLVAMAPLTIDNTASFNSRRK